MIILAKKQHKEHVLMKKAGDFVNISHEHMHSIIGNKNFIWEETTCNAKNTAKNCYHYYVTWTERNSG